MNISLHPSQDKQVYTLLVDGEIDVSNADQLRVALNQLLDDEVAHAMVDLTNVGYIDSTGIGVLMGAAHRAKDLKTHLSVVCPHKNIRRIFDMLGVGDVVELRSHT